MRRLWCKCRPGHVTYPSRWPARPHGQQPIYPHLGDARPWTNVTEDLTWMYRNGDLWTCPFCGRVWVLDSVTEVARQQFGLDVLFISKTFAKPQDWRRETRRERKKRLQ